jgi:hypothetical protein
MPSAASLTNAPQLVAPAPVETFTGEGAVIKGGVVSTTFTVLVAVVAFVPSLTVYVSV